MDIFTLLLYKAEKIKEIIKIIVIGKDFIFNFNLSKIFIFFTKYPMKKNKKANGIIDSPNGKNISFIFNNIPIDNNTNVIIDNFFTELLQI